MSRTGVFRLLIDVDGNGKLDPGTAPAGGDQPIYLPGYEVDADPGAETRAQFRIVKGQTMALMPAGVRELRAQALSIVQRVTVIAHHSVLKRGRVTFVLTDAALSRRKGICTN